MRIVIDPSRHQPGYDVWEEGNPRRLISHHEKAFQARQAGAREAAQRGWRLVSNVDNPQPRLAVL